MSGNMQLRADFGRMEQVEGTINTFKGKVSTGEGQTVLDAAMREVHNMGDGLGADDLASVRAKLEGLVADWEQTQTTHQTATTNARESLQMGGRKALSAIRNAQI